MARDSVKRYDLNLTTCAFLGFLALFFGLFLFYPVGLLLQGAFVSGGRFSLEYFQLLVSSPLQRESLRNSFAGPPFEVTTMSRSPSPS